MKKQAYSTFPGEACFSNAKKGCGKMINHFATAPLLFSFYLTS